MIHGYIGRASHASKAAPKSLADPNEHEASPPLGGDFSTFTTMNPKLASLLAAR